MTNTLYRVHEITDINIGMYHTRLSEVSLNMFEINSYHPEPDNDDLLKTNGYKNKFSYRYGFASLDQLKTWIYRNEWRLKLHEDGLIISVIESDHIIVGDTQAVFDSNCPYQIIKTLNLTEI